MISNKGSSKSTVLICHGHLYLFWSTGVYYTSLISQEYDVSLLVPLEYADSEQFHDICEFLGIVSVSYYEYCGYNIILHYKNSMNFRALLKRLDPYFVLQHDYIGIENMYLFHWARKFNPHRSTIVVTTSFPSNHRTNVLLSQYKVLAAKRLPYASFLPLSIVLRARNVLSLVLSFWRNMLLPMMVLRESPYFPVSGSSNIDIRLRKKLFSHYFHYDPIELDFVSSVLPESSMFGVRPHRLVEPPFVSQPKVDQFLYKSKTSNVVCISPSLIGHKEFEDEYAGLECWSGVLNEAWRQLQDYQFVIKFHPGSDAHRLKRIERFFLEQCPFLQIFDGERIEDLLLQSKVIIGDVSTTLWLSRFRGGKVLISCDAREMATSSVMSNYSGVICVESSSDLAKHDLHALIAEKSNENMRCGNSNLLDELTLLESEC